MEGGLALTAGLCGGLHKDVNQPSNLFKKSQLGLQKSLNDKMDIVINT